VVSGRVIEGDNLAVLSTIDDATIDLIYVDPPFNTGRSQVRSASTSRRSTPGKGRVTGFAGHSYERVRTTLMSYDDQFDDYWSFLEPRLIQSVGLPTGTEVRHFVAHLADIAIPSGMVVLKYWLAHECSSW
jgi:site-specific DNA-methyltransferase (adenine-specific)